MPSPWRDKSVFVTGASGFLGGWLVSELVHRGAAVVVLVRDWVPESRFLRDGLLDRVVTVRGCVEDFDLLERSLNEYGISTVFHLAAQTIVSIANRNPRSTFESNIRGTWNLLEACRRVPTVKQVIVASSDKAYGAQDKLPYDETSPLNARHPYDVSKSCADMISLSYYHTYGLPVCVTRCGNLFGGGDLNFDRLVPGTILSALQGEQPLIRSNGEYVRDYFFVKEGAGAYLHLCEQMEQAGIAGEAFNFSSERQDTAIGMVRLILRLVGRDDLDPVILNQATNEIPAQYLSARKAREMLHWSPRFDLESALVETIDWYRSYLERRRR